MGRKSKKKWKPLDAKSIDSVKPGTKIRNNKGEEFLVVKVFGKDAEGILQVECKPLTRLPDVIEWTGTEWRLA